MLALPLLVVAAAAAAAAAASAAAPREQTASPFARAAPSASSSFPSAAGVLPGIVGNFDLGGSSQQQPQQQRRGGGSLQCCAKQCRDTPGGLCASSNGTCVETCAGDTFCNNTLTTCTANSIPVGGVCSSSVSDCRDGSTCLDQKLNGVVLVGPSTCGYQGYLPQGANCTSDHACFGGLCSGGTCRVFYEGESCATCQACCSEAHNLYCNSSQVCVPRIADGAPCPAFSSGCQLNSVCGGNITSRTCQPMLSLPNGAPCDPSQFFNCNSLWCDPANATCAPLPPVLSYFGSPCDTSINCSAGEYCSCNEHTGETRCVLSTVSALQANVYDQCRAEINTLVSCSASNDCSSYGLPTYPVPGSSVCCRQERLAFDCCFQSLALCADVPGAPCPADLIRMGCPAPPCTSTITTTGGGSPPMPTSTAASSVPTTTAASSVPTTTAGNVVTGSGSAITAAASTGSGSQGSGANPTTGCYVGGGGCPCTQGGGCDPGLTCDTINNVCYTSETPASTVDAASTLAASTTLVGAVLLVVAAAPF